MEESNLNNYDLIAGIEKAAHDEADTLMSEAQKVVNERRAAAEHQATDILKKALRKSQDQTEKIKKNMDSTIDLETRHNSLKISEQTINSVLDEVRKKFEGIIETSDYRQVLIDWIVEAAIGINEQEIEVNASAGEMAVIDDNLLKKAQEKLFGITGFRVNIKKKQKRSIACTGSRYYVKK